jgi:hypothetical protein
MTDFDTQSGPVNTTAARNTQVIYVYGNGSVSLGPRVTTVVGSGLPPTFIYQSPPIIQKEAGLPIDVKPGDIATKYGWNYNSQTAYDSPFEAKYIYGQPATNSSVLDNQATKPYRLADGSYTYVPAANASSVIEDYAEQGGSIPAPPENPNGYKWNLPPHRWSMPLMPSSKTFATGAKGRMRTPVSDAYRRGRIWWKANDPTVKVFTSDKKGTVDKTSKVSQLSNGEDRRYGFQFLWNPETFGTSVAVQMDATPTAGDRFLSVAGAFPATETITFNIRIDRTNDFACAAGATGRPTQIAKVGSGVVADNWVTKDYARRFMTFYNKARGGFFFGTNYDEEMFVNNIVDLLQRGTIADIEYLYKAINGPGPGSVNAQGVASKWVNSRGIATSDIGFLMPTLLNIDIGPLSYQGYVTNLKVDHTSFTQEMIPIRSDLTISLNLLATVGLAGVNQK